MDNEIAKTIDTDELQGRSCLFMDVDGLCHIGTMYTDYPVAFACGEPRKVLGWGRFDGVRQWYRLGVVEPELGWEFCFV